MLGKFYHQRYLTGYKTILYISVSVGTTFRIQEAKSNNHMFVLVVTWQTWILTPAIKPREPFSFNCLRQKT